MMRCIFRVIVIPNYGHFSKQHKYNLMIQNIDNAVSNDVVKKVYFFQL